MFVVKYYVCVGIYMGTYVLPRFLFTLIDRSECRCYSDL